MTDVRFQPSNTEPEIPDVPAINCLASSYDGHVYYSTDNGATWTTRADNLGLPPPTNQQRVELAYSRSNPFIVYASKAGVYGSPAELFRSENGGFSFTSRGHPYAPTVPGGLPGVFWYANVLWVDPTDPNASTVVVGGIFTLRSTDGGATWDEASYVPNDHQDHHAMVEDPLYDGVHNTAVYEADDGGIHYTQDILRACDNPPCVQWSSLNNRLSVTQFYGAAGHGRSGMIIGGTQDNGTPWFHGTSDGNWDIPGNWDILCGPGPICGGDNAFCAIDQTDQPYLYAEFFNLQIFRNKNDGSGSEWIWGGPGHTNGIPPDCNNFSLPCADALAPFVIDPNPNQQERILAGGKSLWRTANARFDPATGVCWAEIKGPRANGDYIAAISIAEGDSDLIWIGYNRSSVFFTTDGTAGGTTCPSPSAIPNWIQGDPFSLLPSNRDLTSITIGNPTSDPPEVIRPVYVTFGGFFPSTTDIHGNVWKGNRNGEWIEIHGTWPNILPSTPIYSLVISPSNPNFLYVGTEVGVFASADGGTHWSPAFGGSASDFVFSLVASSAASDPDIVYVGTDVGVFATADGGETWVPGFGGPANTPVRELFWMINGSNRKLVVATHGRGIFSLTAAN